MRVSHLENIAFRKTSISESLKEILIFISGLKTNQIALSSNLNISTVTVRIARVLPKQLAEDLELSKMVGMTNIQTLPSPEGQ